MRRKGGQEKRKIKFLFCFGNDVNKYMPILTLTYMPILTNHTLRTNHLVAQTAYVQTMTEYRKLKKIS